MFLSFLKTVMYINKIHVISSRSHIVVHPLFENNLSDQIFGENLTARKIFKRVSSYFFRSLTFKF